MVKNIARYSTNAQAMVCRTRQIAARAYLVQIILNTIIITSIILLSANYILPLVADSKFGNAIAALITSSYFSFMHYHCDALLLNR
jgi:CPA2 family monovalent cation:H+ antiporter-2